MATGWKNDTKSNWTGINSSSNTKKREIVVKGKPIEKKKNAWLSMTLILIGGMLTSWGVGLAINAIGAAASWSYFTTAITNAFFTGAIDLGANILSEMSMGRLNKSRMFLFLMPILGVEWLGKINSLLKVQRQQNKLIKGLKDFVFIDKRGIKRTMPKEVLNAIKKDPQRFLNQDQEWLKHIKFAYKGDKQKNEFSRRYVRMLQDKAKKMNWDKKHMKQTLWNEFGDESIFNQNVFETMRNAGKYRQGKSSAFMKQKSIIDKQGGVEFGEAIVQRMAEIKQTMFKSLASRFGGNTLRGSSGHLISKMNYKLNKNKNKLVQRGKGILYKTQAQDLKVVGFKDIIGDSAFGTLSLRLNFVASVIHSYTKALRYLNPLLLIRSATRYTAKAFVKGAGKFSQKIAPGTFTRLSEVWQNANKKGKDITSLKFAKGKATKELFEKMSNQFNLIPVISKWIIGYHLLYNQRMNKMPKPLQVFFNPITTNGKRKNIGGKRPVWSAPKSDKEIIAFRKDPGRYYLKNIAYGFDYASQSIYEQTLRNLPLPIQPLLYSGWRVKRDIAGTQRAIKSLRTMSIKEYDNIFKRAIAPTLSREVSSQIGIGWATNSFTTQFISKGFNSNSLSGGGKTLVSRRLSVVRRRQNKKVEKIPRKRSGKK